MLLDSFITSLFNDYPSLLGGFKPGCKSIGWGFGVITLADWKGRVRNHKKAPAQNRLTLDSTTKSAATGNATCDVRENTFWLPTPVCRAGSAEAREGLI